jgi:hypothetical protein
MDYIAIEGETPRPVDDLRLLLPTVSFPEAEITSAADLGDFITLAGYEVCVVTNLASDITPAWNQFVALGAATRVDGALQASWSAVSMPEDVAASTLAAAKTTGQSDVDTTTLTVQETIAVFASGTGENDPAVSLRPGTETIANLSQLLLVAQNANTGATVVDANGAAVNLTLAQLQVLTAAVVEANADLTAARAIAKASIIAATDTTAISIAVAVFNGEYGMS